MPKTNSVIKALVFDFDGVLVESNSIKEAAFKDLFDEFPEYAEKMKAFHGSNKHRPRKEKFEYGASLFPEEKRDEVREYLHMRFATMVEERVTVCAEVEGADALLKRKWSVPLYISSVTPEEELRRIIQNRGWANYFTGVYGLPPTTKETVMHHIQSDKGIQMDEILFVGDSYSDYEVAEKTGVRFICRSSENKFTAPNLISVKDMAELENILVKELEIL